MRHAISVSLIAFVLVQVLTFPSSPTDKPTVVATSFSQVQPILAVLSDDLPLDLKKGSQSELETAWPAWIKRHEGEVRARLLRGEEDTMVNFLTFGTSFTAEPRLTAAEFARLGPILSQSQPSPDHSPTAAIFFKRLEDLLRGMANPGTNERLLFVARLAEIYGYHPRQAQGSHPDLAEQKRLKAFLIANAVRVIQEQAGFQKEFEQARRLNDRSEDFAIRSKLYRSRGISLDTSLFPNLGIEESLKAMLERNLIAPGSIRKVAIIGAGLDFTDKGGGYDYYPTQSIQCFALMDSLLRLGLARSEELKLTALDVSQQVNDHLARAKRNAARGQDYVLQLPLDSETPWKAVVSRYWKGFGNQIGRPITPIRVPALTRNVETRAVSIRPAVVSMISSVNLDIVTQHLQFPPSEGFDLIVATNVFLYFDLFEQFLAMANAQEMLRPGGFLLSNNSLPVLDNSGMRAVDYLSIFYSERQDDGDVIVWYQKSSP
ncbi:MAG: class I SAM-dependent methyltransferase [Terriglobia bacterium]